MADPTAVLWSFIEQLKNSLFWFLGLVGNRSGCASDSNPLIRGGQNIYCAVQGGFVSFAQAFGFNAGDGLSLALLTFVLIAVLVFVIWLLYRIFKKWVLLAVVVILVVFLVRAAAG